MTILVKNDTQLGQGPAIMANETRIAHVYRVAGQPCVPWRYARHRKGGTRPPYGTYGVPLRPRGPFELSFFKKFQAAVQDIWAASSMFLMPPGYSLDAIVVASTYRKNAGKHGMGRAIDIDSLWWNPIWGSDSVTPEYNAQPRGLVANMFNENSCLYLAVTAIWYLHFGTVLWFLYPDHECHWHLDDGSRVGLRKVDLSGRPKHRILFIQAALVHLFGVDPGPLDGKWGHLTYLALASVMKDVFGNDFDRRMMDKMLLERNLWTDFLKACVRQYGMIVRGR